MPRRFQRVTPDGKARAKAGWHACVVVGKVAMEEVVKKAQYV